MSAPEVTHPPEKPLSECKCGCDASLKVKLRGQETVLHRCWTCGADDINPDSIESIL